MEEPHFYSHFCRNKTISESFISDENFYAILAQMWIRNQIQLSRSFAIAFLSPELTQCREPILGITHCSFHTENV